MRRIALATGSSKVMVDAQEEQADVYCREQRFRLAAWHPSPRSYSGNQTTPLDLAEPELQFRDDVDIRHNTTKHMSPEAHFAFTDFPEALQIQLADSQCNGTNSVPWCTVFPELAYAPFPQSSISKFTLAKNLLRPQSTLVLSTGEANLGAHNFSNEIGPSLAIEAEAQATRLLGQSMRYIQLPMETMSTQTPDAPLFARLLDYASLEVGHNIVSLSYV